MNIRRHISTEHKFVLRRAGISRPGHYAELWSVAKPDHALKVVGFVRVGNGMFEVEALEPIPGLKVKRVERGHRFYDIAACDIALGT